MTVYRKWPRRISCNPPLRARLGPTPVRSVPVHFRPSGVVLADQILSCLKIVLRYRRCYVLARAVSAVFLLFWPSYFWLCPHLMGWQVLFWVESIQVGAFVISARLIVDERACLNDAVFAVIREQAVPYRCHGGRV